MDLWVDLPFDKRDVLREDETEVDFSYISFQNRKQVTNSLVIDILSEKVIGINLNYCPKISDSCISHIIKSCPKIADLFVAGCPQITDWSISTIPDFCNTIKCLNVSENNNITSRSIDKLIKTSPQLEQLWAYKCAINSLPEQMGFLLPNLQTLWINNNKITKLPRTITKLIGVCDYFYASGNPLQDPPLSIVNGGLEAIRSYFNQDYEREVFGRKEQLFDTLFSALRNFSKDDDTLGLHEEKTVILEIGIGNFPNAIFYKQANIDQLDIIGIDPDKEVNTLVRDSIKRAGTFPKHSLRIIHATSEALPLPDASVNAVVCTLTLCSVCNPSKSLNEIKRVLKPGGKFLFWEHVLSETDESLRKCQIALSPQQIKITNGCHLDRRTGESIKEAGFSKCVMKYLELTNFAMLNPTICGIATA